MKAWERRGPQSWIARAMGNSAGFSVVTGTFGAWQAAGHLGDMLREMRKSFAEARTRAPSVLIIDEIGYVTLGAAAGMDFPLRGGGVRSEHHAAIGMTACALMATRASVGVR